MYQADTHWNPVNNKSDVILYNYFSKNPLLPLINKEVFDILNRNTKIFNWFTREKLSNPEVFSIISACFMNVLISLQYNKSQIIEELFEWKIDDVITKIKAKMSKLYWNLEI